MSRELAAWRTTLPERSRYDITWALRQTLEAAVRWGDMDRNPAKDAGAQRATAVTPDPRVHGRRVRGDGRS